MPQSLSQLYYSFCQKLRETPQIEWSQQRVKQQQRFYLMPAMEKVAVCFTQFSEMISQQAAQQSDYENFADMLNALSDLIAGYSNGREQINWGDRTKFDKLRDGLIYSMGNLHLALMNRLIQAEQGHDPYVTPDDWRELLKNFLVSVQCFYEANKANLMGPVIKDISLQKAALATLLRQVFLSATFIRGFREWPPTLAADLLGYLTQITIGQPVGLLAIPQLPELAGLYLDRNNIFTEAQDHDLTFSLAKARATESDFPTLQLSGIGAETTKKFMTRVVEAVQSADQLAQQWTQHTPLARMPWIARQSCHSQYYLVATALALVLKYCQHYFDETYFVALFNALEVEKFLGFVLRGAELNLIPPMLQRQLLLRMLILVVVNRQHIVGDDVEKEHALNQHITHLLTALDSLKTRLDAKSIWLRDDSALDPTDLTVSSAHITRQSFLQTMLSQALTSTQFRQLLNLLSVSSDIFLAHCQDSIQAKESQFAPKSAAGSVVVSCVAIIQLINRELKQTLAQAFSPKQQTRLLTLVENSYAVLLQAQQFNLLTIDRLRTDADLASVTTLVTLLFSLDPASTELAVLVNWVETLIKSERSAAKAGECLLELLEHFQLRSINVDAYLALIDKLTLAGFLAFITRASEQESLSPLLQWQLLLRWSVLAVVHANRLPEAAQHLQQLVSKLNEVVKVLGTKACWLQPQEAFSTTQIVVRSVGGQPNSFLQLMWEHLTGRQLLQFLSVFQNDKSVFADQMGKGPRSLFGVINRELMLSVKSLSNDPSIAVILWHRAETSYALLIQAYQFRQLTADDVAAHFSVESLAVLITLGPSLQRALYDGERQRPIGQFYQLLFKALLLRLITEPAKVEWLYMHLSMQIPVTGRLLAQASTAPPHALQVAFDLRLLTSALPLFRKLISVGRDVPEPVLIEISEWMCEPQYRNHFAEDLLPLLAKANLSSGYRSQLFALCVAPNGNPTIAVAHWQGLAMTTFKRGGQLPLAVLDCLTAHNAEFARANAFTAEGLRFNCYPRYDAIKLPTYLALKKAWDISLQSSVSDVKNHTVKLTFTIPQNITCTDRYKKQWIIPVSPHATGEHSVALMSCQRLLAKIHGKAFVKLNLDNMTFEIIVKDSVVADQTNYINKKLGDLVGKHARAEAVKLEQARATAAAALATDLQPQVVVAATTDMADILRTEAVNESSANAVASDVTPAHSREAQALLQVFAQQQALLQYLQAQKASLLEQQRVKQEALAWQQQQSAQQAAAAASMQHAASSLSPFVSSLYMQPMHSDPTSALPQQEALSPQRVAETVSFFGMGRGGSSGSSGGNAHSPVDPATDFTQWVSASSAVSPVTGSGASNFFAGPVWGSEPSTSNNSASPNHSRVSSSGTLANAAMTASSSATPSALSMYAVATSPERGGASVSSSPQRRSTRPPPGVLTSGATRAAPSSLEQQPGGAGPDGSSQANGATVSRFGGPT